MKCRDCNQTMKELRNDLDGVLITFEYCKECGFYKRTSIGYCEDEELENLEVI